MKKIVSKHIGFALAALLLLGSGDEVAARNYDGLPVRDSVKLFFPEYTAKDAIEDYDNGSFDLVQSLANRIEFPLELELDLGLSIPLFRDPETLEDIFKDVPLPDFPLPDWSSTPLPAPRP